MTTENFRISFLIFFGGSLYANIYLGHILHPWKFTIYSADEYSNICTYVYIGKSIGENGRNIKCIRNRNFIACTQLKGKVIFGKQNIFTQEFRHKVYLQVKM
jgi:hypothetical protein